jgi:hypothetical protein
VFCGPCGKTGFAKRPCEGVCVKPIIPWMVEEPARDWVVYEGPQDLLRVEHATRLEHALYLAERQSPLRYVMDDAEVEDGVVGRSRYWNRRRVPHPEANPRSSRAQPLAGARNHPRVEIEGVNGIGTEHVENEACSHPTAATELERPPARHWTAHAQQAARLKVPLERRARRVVHERKLKAVQQHVAPSLVGRTLD